ncbi:MAG: AAA family ATPase [Mollicutes bacterium]|nr:AAA family ATPase [Mollicutes bacterium]
MQLTNKQEQGLKEAILRFAQGEKYTIISGYAGTGKTVLIKFIIEALQIDPKKVVYATFTGKAAEVLRKKGNKNVMTLHRLLYRNILMPNGKYARIPKNTLEYDIVVIDELSMVPEGMIKQLLSYDIYLLGLGDPFQLPPINPKTDNHLLDHPHVFLDEIMRQAKESEIIRLTMDIREGKEIPYQKGSEVQVLPSSEVVFGMYTWADQIICATNQTRQNINQQYRFLKFGNEQSQSLLLPNDKIICLQNNWDIFSENEAPLVNGMIGTVVDFNSDIVSIKIGINRKDFPVYILKKLITDDNDYFSNIIVDKLYLQSSQQSISLQDIVKIKKQDKIKIPQLFDYGYAITCHKAQGSQWDNVLVFEENFPFKKEEHAKWLYTACTRSASRLVLIK